MTRNRKRQAIVLGSTRLNPAHKATNQSGAITIGQILLILGTVVLLYVLGVFVRQRFGIGITLRNETSENLRNVQIRIKSRGPTYNLADLNPGQKHHLFVTPVTESNVNTLFTDAAGRKHDEIVVGYAEQGYCGNATVIIRRGGSTQVSEHVDPVFCARSWLDFLATSNLQVGAL